MLVTGTQGQVARSLVEQSKNFKNFEVLSIGRPELDLLNAKSINDALMKRSPDIIINAAAYTNVDSAESFADEAFTINSTGAQCVATAANELNIPIIQLSTDYVFDGTSNRAYTEEDIPNPISVYGKSKYLGETLVSKANPKHIILRTAWVYGPFSRNFLKTMLRLANQKEIISVVSDQWGNPTSSTDIAKAILTASNYVLRSEFDEWGIYNFVGKGDCTWATFAEAIFALSAKHGLPFAKVDHILAASYKTLACRPANSKLNCQKFSKQFNWEFSEWQHSLEEVFENKTTLLA